MNDLPEAAVSRFWSRVDRTTGDCWIWTGSKTSAGYGNLAIQQRWHYAHRLSYELVIGPIPEGLVIDHLCRVRHCVNPDHLEPVTNRVNIARGMAPYGLRTTCRRGHDITSEANVYVQPDGGRRCRLCALEDYRASAEKRNARKRNNHKECPECGVRRADVPRHLRLVHQKKVA